MDSPPRTSTTLERFLTPQHEMLVANAVRLNLMLARANQFKTPPDLTALQIESRCSLLRSALWVLRREHSMAMKFHSESMAKTREWEQNGWMCPICFDDAHGELGDACALTQCGHCFHLVCLAGYLEHIENTPSDNSDTRASVYKPNCPVCRRRVRFSNIEIIQTVCTNALMLDSQLTMLATRAVMSLKDLMSLVSDLVTVIVGNIETHWRFGVVPAMLAARIVLDRQKTRRRSIWSTLHSLVSCFRVHNRLFAAETWDCETILTAMTVVQALHTQVNTLVEIAEWAHGLCFAVSHDIYALCNYGRIAASSKKKQENIGKLAQSLLGNTDIVDIVDAHVPLYSYLSLPKLPDSKWEAEFIRIRSPIRDMALREKIRFMISASDACVRVLPPL